MKKSLCIISVLYYILPTACGNDSSIGIICGAILIPYTEIETKAEEMLPDKDKLIWYSADQAGEAKLPQKALLGKSCRLCPAQKT